MAKYKPSDLQKIYTEADSADKKIFAEMRSNVLLISGEHYSKMNSRFLNRIRDDRSLSEEQKLRLTKNHVQKIQKYYSSQITSSAPGVTVSPANEKELQDQKSAELDLAVWQDAERRFKLDQRVQEWSDEFTGIGEVHVKLSWNPNAGDFLGYEPVISEEGYLVQDENGQPIPTEDARFSGQMMIESVFGFNMLRHASAKNFDESPVLIIRKMVDVDDVTRLIDSLNIDDQEKQDRKKLAVASADQTYTVFDANSGQYKKSENQCLWKEFHFRSCPDYPNGQYFIMVGEGLVDQGDHPFGIFPIVSELFETYPTYPRGVGPVRTMRPYQIEINRASSKIAEHQVTLGDDKLIMFSGSKLAPGTSVAGVRGITVSGAAPTILPGRDGSQYLAYLNAQIAELYSVMMVNELSAEKDGQLDPYAMLFRAASQKMKFNRYIKRFENFLVKICETYLDLCRHYFTDDMVVAAIGKRESVNISEFKNNDKLSRRVKCEPQSDDVESKLGRQLSINHLLQYSGQKLERQDIGMLYRLMPYADSEQMSGDLTIDYDNATNDILSLDRAQLPVINQYDDHEYMIKRATNRMRQADFRQLAPQIQAIYQQYIQQREQILEQQQQAIQAAQAGFIPTGGYLVTLDFYVPDPQNPSAQPRRARLPYEAIQWLVQRLEQQGSSLEQLEQMQKGNLSDMAQMSVHQRMLGGPGMEAQHPDQRAAAMAHGAVPNGRPQQPSLPGPGRNPGQPPGFPAPGANGLNTFNAALGAPSPAG